MVRFIILFFILSMTALTQQISYIIPDIGRAGMNSYVEIIGPDSVNGNFGANGLYLNNPGDNVRIELVRPGDSTKICFGPLVVSWNGRMISSQAFINPFVSPNSENWLYLTNEFRIPYRVFVNGSYSNVDTFYIVKPFMFGDITSGGHWEIGSGSLGVRSRRGAMIIGYTKFGNRNYGISLADCDPYSGGNQGFLPFILLSKDIIEGDGTNTYITASGNGRIGGPGGGGGGGRFCDGTFVDPLIGDDGGDGFTGGGPGGRNNSGGTTNLFKNPGNGTGINGASLNGVTAPAAQWYESSGGGTGHPFGISGQGCGDGNNCNPTGGYGGGSGYQQNSRGGAGGFRTNGNSSGSQNGGYAYGGDDGIPIAGGSGGASGNPNSPNNCSGNGGGGGGAVRIAALSLNKISVRAIGADGAASTYGAQATGGAGSGGYVELGVKLAILNSNLVVTGGNAGMGGIGLTRLDSPFNFGSTFSPANVTVSRGLTTDSTSNVYKKFRLTGSKSAAIDSVRLYIKSASTSWMLDTVLAGLRNITTWERNYYLPGPDSVYYIAAVADRQSYSEQSIIVNQRYLMSQSAANVIFKNKNPEILSDTIRKMKSLACEGKSTLDSFYIYNKGDAGLLLDFNKATWRFGNRGFSLFSPIVSTWVNPNDSVKVFIKYTYITGQRGIIRDTLSINHNDLLAASNPLRIAYEVELDSVVFNLLNASQQSTDTLDFGKLCINDSLDLGFYINNQSSIPLNVFEKIIGSNSFIQLNDLTPMILPGNKSKGIVRFKPSSVGKISALLIYSSIECAEIKDTIVLMGEGISGEFAFEKPLNYRIDTLVLGSYCVGGSVHSYFLLRGYGGQTLTFTPQQRIVTPKFIYESKATGTIPDKSWDTVHFDIWPLSEGPLEFKVGTKTYQCAGFSDSLVIKLTGVKAVVNYIGIGDFGVLNNDYRDTLSIDIRNDGSADMYIESLKPLNPPFSYINMQPPPPALIKPGEFMTVKIEFYPRNDGFFTDSVCPVMLLSDSTCLDNKIFPLKGISTSSQLILSTDTLNFGVLQYCDELQDSVTITNPTTVTISLTNPRIQGPDASFFNEVQGFISPRILAPTQSAVYYIRFKPTWGPDGIRRAQFAVNSDFPKQPLMTVELIGEQENLKVTANPPDLSFGSVPIGIQKVQTIRLTNNGKISQNLKNVVINNPDMSASPTAGPVPGGGGFIDVDVTFKPMSAGIADADILFIFRGLRGGQEKCEDTLRTKIYANGQEGQVLITSRIIYELRPPCSDGLDSMEIINTGASAVSVDSMIIGGQDGSLFTFADARTMPVVLDSGDTVVRYIKYTSFSNKYGVKNAFVITYINVGAKIVADTTFLIAERRDFITVSPNPLNFGNVVVGQFNELDLTLTNKGNSAVVISGILPPFNNNEFYFNPVPVGLVINANSSQIVKLRFRPTAPIAYFDSSGVIEVYVSACQDTSYFKMTGTGIPPIDTRIMIDTVSNIDPRDYVLNIPIRAYITNPVATVQNLEFRASISFNATMYNLHKINNGTIQNDSLAGNMRFINFLVAGITLTNDTAIIATLSGRPLLGNSDFTMINWEKFNWVNPAAFGKTDTIPGSIRTKICTSGGPRLLNPGLPLAMFLSPNPADGELNVKITTLETGMHYLRLFDFKGAEKIIKEFEVNLNGTHELEFNINLSEYSTGYYYFILSSPTEKIVVPVSIIK